LFQISGSRSGHLFFGGRIHSPVERHSNHPQGMKQLINPPWITAKGVLFLFLGLLSGTLLFLERPTARVGLLFSGNGLVVLPLLLFCLLRDAKLCERRL
jgi:hypothetical protein